MRTRTFLATACSLAVAVGGLTVATAPPAQAATESLAASSKLPAENVVTLKSNYAVPSSAVFVDPNGSNSNPGTKAAPYKTINHAMMQVKDGGTVVARGGVYREGAAGYATGGTNYIVRLATGKGLSGVTLQAYPNETVWMDGTEEVSSWTKVSGTNYKASWSTPSLCAGRYYSTSLGAQTTQGPCSYGDSLSSATVANPQMVFVDGKEIKEVGSLSALTSGTFYYNHSARTVHLGFNPAGKTIEVTKHPQALALLKATNVSIKGIGFRRYASNQYDNATNGAVLLNGGSNVLLEKVVATENAGAGLTVWGTNKLTVRSSALSSNGANGMNFSGSQPSLASNPSVRDDVTIEYSRFDRNNTDFYGINCSYGCTSAGVKMSGVVGAHVRWSTFNFNNGGRASGLWCDLGCSDYKIYGNKMIGNARHGIVYEVSNTGVIASNVVGFNGWGSTAYGGGFGIMVGSANTRIYNNTVTDNKYGVFIYDDARTPSSSGMGARVGPNSVNVSLVNNVIASAYAGSGELLRVMGGTSTVSANRSADQVMGTLNYNSYSKPQDDRFVYYAPYSDKAVTLYKTIESWRSAKGKEANGTLSLGATPILLVAPASGKYEVKAGSAAAGTSSALPTDIASLLGVSASAKRNRGAITLGAE